MPSLSPFIMLLFDIVALLGNSVKIVNPFIIQFHFLSVPVAEKTIGIEFTIETNIHYQSNSGENKIVTLQLNQDLDSFP